MQPLVSIAIPTYNRLRYLRPCLESIKAQTIGAVKLYIFDDGSTEPIEAEARRLFGDELTFIPSEKNYGASANIQRALKYPYKTPYVIVFHDDDVMHPRLLAEEVALLERKENQDVAFCGSLIAFCPTETSMKYFHASTEQDVEYTKAYTHTDLITLFLKNYPVGFSSILYRTTSLTSAPNLDFARFGPNNDRPFLVELSKKRGALIIINRLVNYRMHEAQDSKLHTSVDAFTRAERLLSYYQAELAETSGKGQALVRRRASNDLLWMLRGMPRSERRRYIDTWKQKGLFSWRSISLIGLRALLSL